MEKVYDTYEAYVKQYTAEFGSQTIVLFQCGSFFEVYSIDDGLVDIRAVCELLNIQFTRKNKSILEVSRENCIMAGFPLHALSKLQTFIPQVWIPMPHLHQTHKP